MGNNGICGNNCLWIILLLILLCGCGGGLLGGCSNGCGCDNNCCC